MSQVVYLSEIRAFFKKNRRSVLVAGGVSFFCTFLLILSLVKPTYLAEASFRQSSAKPDETSSLQTILRTMRISSEEPPAIGVMQSKSLLKKAVVECGLQLEVVSQEKFFPLLMRELRVANRKNNPQFLDVQLQGERGETFAIKPLSKDAFEVVYANGKKEGRLGSTVCLERSSWTLQTMPAKQMSFRIISERDAISKLQKLLKIKPSRIDGNVLLLKFRHPEREKAIALLNAVMDHYQKYLEEEHQLLAKEQIRYLQKRRDELEKDFELALDSHVAYLQNSLSADGFLGLSQEVAMLGEPKEMYAGKRHELDLQQKRWREEGLEASTDHPWKEGLAKQEHLSFQQQQVLSQGAISEEFEGIDLETAEKLHANYCHSRDEIHSQIRTLNSFRQKMDESGFEVSALSQVLSDEVSQGIIQKAAQCSLQLADLRNYTTKERGRLEETALTQKKFLCEHIEKQKSLLELKHALIEEKIISLKQTALALIQREKAGVDAKLLEIKEKMHQLPEKWRLENQLKLKKELNMQILEGLAQLSESKVVNHHLFHVESKPLDPADASLDIEPPHLILFSSIGGLLGGLFFFFFILIRGVVKGLPISEEYLRSLKYPIYLQNSFDKLAIAIQTDSVTALMGYPDGEKLVEALKKLGRKAVVLREQEMPYQHKDFPDKLSSYKTEYDCILLECDAPDGLSDLVDRYILNVDQQKGEDLDLFDREKTLCVLSP